MLLPLPAVPLPAPHTLAWPSSARRIEWGDPFAGKAADTFELSEDGATLTHNSDMTAAADGTRVVYK